MREPTQYKIFISYRRNDTQYTTDRIAERLAQEFGRDAIFQDVAAVPLGSRFPDYISTVIQACCVALVVIGPTWTTEVASEGSHAGQPRLHDPDDYVRREVEQVLARSAVDSQGRTVGDLLLIPLLVQGATMPRAEDLPESLRDLTLRNATSIRRNPGFEEDMRRLIIEIKHRLEECKPSPRWPSHWLILAGAVLALLLTSLGLFVIQWQALAAHTRFLTASALVYGSAVLAGVIWLAALIQSWRLRRLRWFGSMLVAGCVVLAVILLIGGIIPYFFTGILSVPYGIVGPTSPSKQYKPDKPGKPT